VLVLAVVSAALYFLISAKAVVMAFLQVDFSGLVEVIVPAQMGMPGARVGVIAAALAAVLNLYCPFAAAVALASAPSAFAPFQDLSLIAVLEKRIH